jgi:hypothetical protein
MCSRVNRQVPELVSLFPRVRIVDTHLFGTPPHFSNDGAKGVLLHKCNLWHETERRRRTLERPNRRAVETEKQSENDAKKKIVQGGYR